MEERITTMQNFRRIKIFDFHDSITDAEVRDELFEKCKNYKDFSINVTIDKNNQRAAYIKFERHSEANKCLADNQFLTIDGLRVACVPVLSKTKDSSNFNTYVPPSASFRARGGWRGSRRPLRSNFSSFSSARRPLQRQVRPACRNLYVGGLNESTTADELLRVFQRYGLIEDIDVKTTIKGTFAFIQYFNLDMAARAHREMEDGQIAGAAIRLGFGESAPSSCLWIGGIGPWTDEAQITREFERFGTIERFDWPEGKNYAYVLFENTDSALDAYRELQGLSLGRDGKRIRLDYTFPKLMDSTLNYKDFNFEGMERDENWDFHAMREFRERDLSRSPSPYRRARSSSVDGNRFRGREENNSSFDRGGISSGRGRAWVNTHTRPLLRGGERGGRWVNTYTRPFGRGGERGSRNIAIDSLRSRGSRGYFGRAGRFDGFRGRCAMDEEQRRDSGRYESSERRDEGRDGDYERRGDFKAGRSSRGSSSYRRDGKEDRYNRDDRSADRDYGHHAGKHRAQSGDRYSEDRRSSRRKDRSSRDRDVARRGSRSSSYDREKSSNVERKRRKVHRGSRGSQHRRSSSVDRRSGSFGRRRSSGDFERITSSRSRSIERRHRNRSRSGDVAKKKKTLSPIRIASQSPAIGRLSPVKILHERSKEATVTRDVLSVPLAQNNKPTDTLPARYPAASEPPIAVSHSTPVTSVANASMHPSSQSVASLQSGPLRAPTNIATPTDNNRQPVASTTNALQQQQQQQQQQQPTVSSTSQPVLGTEGVNPEIARRFPVVWSGAMVLKNSAFVTNMYLVSGSVPLVDSLLRDPSAPDCPVLKISQRLRLDEPLKLDELERRIASSGRNGCSVLLAAPAAAQVGDVNNVIQQRPLSSLGVYLHEKECAAVIFLPPGGTQKGSDTGVLHAFPPSKFATEFLRKEAPDLVPNYPKDDHLLIIVMRDLTL